MFFLTFSPYVARLPVNDDVRNHGSHFEQAKAAFEEGAAKDEAIIEKEFSRSDMNLEEGGVGNEKGSVERRETVDGEDVKRGSKN